MTYIYILITVFFAIPVALFLILLIHDVYRLHERRKAVKYLHSGQSKILVRNRERAYKKRAHRYFRMVQAMIGVFILQWTPYVVNTLIINVTNQKLSFWLDFSANMIAKASTISNPVIYLIWEKQASQISNGSSRFSASTRSQASIKYAATDRKSNV